ncbi:MAG: hypothetical protein NTX86_06285 [Candidatus Dependentiae bacterium]|nr:hypothetical protein [Candidatus Dependentiae bacterium]
MKNNNAFAEIIESSLQGWLAQSWQWNQCPQFGSLVTVQTKKRTLFGIVHQVNTGSMEPMRYPFPYQKTEEELLRDQPQIFEFLKTTFSCLAIGYLEKGHIYYLATPEPPQIHSFVQSMDQETMKQFFAKPTYLHLLFGSSNQLFNLDDLLLILLKQQAELNIASANKITTFINTYSLLTGNDYRRLKLFLQRASDIIETPL